MENNSEERDQRFFISAANELIGRTNELESITAHQYSRLDILVNELLSSINETTQSASHSASQSAVERAQQNTLNEKPVYKVACCDMKIFNDYLNRLTVFDKVKFDEAETRTTGP